MSTALVLAGGGVTGIAWETGVLLGLQRTGRLPAADLVIGTSAGSAVGAQLLSGTDLEELYARQVADEHGEIAPELDLARLIAFFTAHGDISAGLPDEAVLEVCEFARTSSTVPLATRRGVIEWRLPSHEWPVAPLRVTTVDARTGELVVLDRESGVPLVDAVMASCAVPGVWPPVPALDRLLIDGGVRSPSHLALAAGHDEVLALVPLPAPAQVAVQKEAEQLARAGAVVTVIGPDARATEAMGPNALDPTKRRVSAEEGLRQGLA